MIREIGWLVPAAVRGRSGHHMLPVTFDHGDQLGARVTGTGVVQIRRNGSLVSSVTLDAADQAYLNGRGGRIGIATLAAPSAFFDDFGGGTWTP